LSSTLPGELFGEGITLIKKIIRDEITSFGFFDIEDIHSVPLSYCKDIFLDISFDD